MSAKLNEKMLDCIHEWQDGGRDNCYISLHIESIRAAIKAFVAPHKFESLITAEERLCLADDLLELISELEKFIIDE